MKEITEIQAVEFCFSPIIGLPCWGVKNGHGSFLEMNFGNPNLKIGEPHPEASGKSRRRTAEVKGDWGLLLWCCSWSIQFREPTVLSVDSESSRRKALQQVHA